MSDPVPLRKYVRFQLDELSTENGHHVFEDICREVARARIASNLLTATGPVAAGGDAGRDFETFTSYLPEELGEHSAFVAKLSGKSLAFACTLQKKGTERKFGKDIQTIAESGDKFDHVYAMCVVAIDVGRRNKLRNTVKRQHGIELTVLDGVWLSEQIATHDLFWVAERYLSVPAHMAPLPPADVGSGKPDWYVEDLKTWQGRSALRPTVRDVLEAKPALRYATFHEHARPDLGFWLSLFEPLTSESHPLGVRQRARYEYATATLRGAGELRPADQCVREFFADLRPDDDDTARLKDAGVLLTYAIGAYRRNLTDLDGDYLRAVNDRLRAQIRAQLDAGPSPTQRALLLDVLGHLGLEPDPLMITPVAVPVPVNGTDYVDDEGNFKPPSEPPQTVGEPLFVDMDEGMGALVDLAAGLDDTPLFPVDDLGQMLNIYAPLLVDHHQWRELVDAVDRAVARTAGDATAGDNARDRAMALLNAERLREALHELHVAKVNWWSGSHIDQSLLAMLLIARIYQRLGLMQAAKQYAIAVAGTALASGDDELRDFIPRGLLAAANADYLAGAWCNAIALFETAFRLLHAISDFDLQDDSVDSAMFNFGALLGASRVIAPELVPHIEEVMQSCDLSGLIDSAAKIRPRTADEIVEATDANLDGRPFADAGVERTIRFAGLGLDWTVRCDNEYDHVMVAERFAGAAQVLLVEMANDDLCFMRTTIDVRVSPAAADEESETTCEDSNDGRRWFVTLMAQPENISTATRRMPEHDFELLTSLTHILVDASLLPRDPYMEGLDRAFSRGLPHKLESGRPYDELARQFLTQETFEAIERKRIEPPADPAEYPAREHPALAWQSDPGPGYSRAAAEEMLSNRYELFPQILRYSLPRLLLEPSFRSLIARFRNEGWLDWQIAGAVFARTLNLRMSASGIGGTEMRNPAIYKQVNDLAYTPEEQSWGTPPATLYTYEELVVNRQLNMLKLVEYWGLELRQQAPDFPAIENILAQRYGYWSDDIEHEDLFTWGAKPAAERKPAQRRTRARRS